MTILNHFNECIYYLEVCSNQFSFLNDIINPSDLRYWTKKLKAQKNLDDFLFGSDAKLNLLNIAIATGFSKEKNLNDKLFDHYKTLLTKVELFLQTFPELKLSKKFKDKLKDIQGLSFLSTMSELSLAFKLKEQGFVIKFETKFKQSVTKKDRDVDLTVSDKNGNNFHLEVYMPNKQVDLNGFFNLNEHDKLFHNKIKAKLLDKFGDNGVSELNGLILLAINKIFFDLLHIKTALPFLQNNYNELIKLCPNDINGLIIFEDGFDSESSFKFEKLLLKQKNSR